MNKKGGVAGKILTPKTTTKNSPTERTDLHQYLCDKIVGRQLTIRASRKREEPTQKLFSAEGEKGIGSCTCCEQCTPVQCLSFSARVRSGEEPIRFVSSNFLYTYIQITPYKHKRARIISRLGGIPPRREKNFLFPPAGPPREHCPSPYSNLPSPLYSLLNSSSRARGSPSSEPLSEELSSESGSSGLELSIPILLGASGMHATSSMLD